MSRILAAHQPNYLPWLGFFHKVGQAAVWVVGDAVQFAKHGFTNRNRIRTSRGWQWLTVPVRTRGKSDQLIRDVAVDTTSTWRRKHWQAIRLNYGGAAHFDSHAAYLEEFFATPWTRLADANLAMCRYVLEQLGIDVEVRLSSEMGLRPERTLRLVDMAIACDCTVYLAGGGASRQYLDVRAFETAGIEVRFDDFQHPTYPQCHEGFEPSMAALDLLLNCGPASREVLLGH